MATSNLGERIAAHGMSLASGVGQRFPSLRDYLAAPRAPSAYHVPVRWKYSPQETRFAPTWIDFKGNPRAGRLPRSYPTAGIISFDKEELQNLEDDYVHKHEAVAFILGRAAVIVGVTDEARASLFTTDPENESRYIVAMRIGKGPLRAAAGIWTPDDGFLGVRNEFKAGVLPVNEIPRQIPVV